ncbi:hypothetical protein HU200_032016 [Digitaria exilis]|uniref:Uncharacterized protein n=1 Tax=Digitaria exilis TaxID=1010633 RepID=A0A835BN79_9POAL|nr:hypothetical protein HU200_032016 [Digitaria exilis]
MSLRRFLYLVADDCVERCYSLRRIDMSRFFFKAPSEGTPTPLDSSGGAGAADPLAIEDSGCLPDPTLSLDTPQLEQGSSLMDFMLFKGKGHDGESLKVVTMDHTGRAVMCDPCSLPPTVIDLPTVTPKFVPFSLTVGSSLYIMDAFNDPPSGCQRHSFEVLSYGYSHSHSRLFKEWYWRSLPPPPCVYEPPDPLHFIDSYSVVAGTDILVSNKAKHTYRFDTVKGTWRKAGDWAMPFSFLAQYVPEHKLWFGLSKGNGYSFLAADLMPPSDSEEMGPPVVLSSWKEYVQPPPEWSLVESHAVHLGSSKFCIIRFFHVGKLCVCPNRKTYKEDQELQVLLTGVQVEGCGQELRVLKHKSERYKLGIENYYWVL